MTGVPEFASRTKHVGQRIENRIFHQQIGLQFVGALQIAFTDGQRIDLHQLQRLGLLLRHFLERGAPGQFFVGEPLVFFSFERIQFIEQPRSHEAERRAGLAGRPNIHEAMQRVLLLLNSQFVTRRAGRAFAATEPAALIKNHRLNGGKQFRGGHQTDRDARAAEHGLDDFAVRKIRNNDAILDRIAADNSAGGNFQIKHRIVRGRELVNEFLRRRAAIPNSGIAFLQNHHATALDFGIIRIHCRCDDVGKAHVRDEASALLHLQQRFTAVLPIRDAHFAGEHSGFDTGERNRLGQRKRRANLFARFTRFQRRGTADIFFTLLRRAAFVNRREAEIACQAARGRAGIHPREFKREQRERQILRPGNVTALLGFQRRSGDAAFIVMLEQAVFFRRPFVRIAPARRHQPRATPRAACTSMWSS